MVSRHNITTGFFIFILFLSLVVFPVQAGIKYYSGGPDLSVAVQGSNELNPGDTIPLSILVENAGKIDMKMTSTGAITPDYLPDTAKTVRITMKPGTTSFIIKTDTQLVGDIPAGISQPVQFLITVPEETESGSYELPVELSYSYVPEVTQVGEDDIEYLFKDELKKSSLLVTIRPKVILNVEFVDTTGLYAGGEGYITLKLKNTGKDDGKNTVIEILPPQGSPIVPVDSAIYIGDFPVGSEHTIKFKVAVNANANKAQKYPVNIVAEYKDFEGLDTQTAPKTIGIQFGGKITFEIIGAASKISSGSSTPIQVTYQNTGENTAYHAQARISLVDPFSSNDDSSYLGDLKPGDKATAVFTITTDSSATIKEYALDSTIRYTDEENNSYLSDPVKVLISVVPADVTGTYVALIVLVLVLASGWFLYRKRQSI